MIKLLAQMLTYPNVSDEQEKFTSQTGKQAALSN